MIIIGNSGSGKTWLATRLAATVSATVVNLDGIFWEPGAFDNKRSHEEIELLIQQSKEEKSWIVEGVFGELAERYLDVAEFLVWLDIDWHVCKRRLEERGSESKKHIGREQSKQGLQNLIEWASEYCDRQDLRSAKGHKALFEEFSGNKAHLRSETDVKRFLDNAQQGTALKTRPADAP